MLWWPGAPVQQQQQQQQSEVQWEEDEQTQGRYEQCRQQHLEKEDNWEEKLEEMQARLCAKEQERLSKLELTQNKVEPHMSSNATCEHIRMLSKLKVTDGT